MVRIIDNQEISMLNNENLCESTTILHHFYCWAWKLGTRKTHMWHTAKAKSFEIANGAAAGGQITSRWVAFNNDLSWSISLSFYVLLSFSIIYRCSSIHLHLSLLEHQKPCVFFCDFDLHICFARQQASSAPRFHHTPPHPPLYRAYFDLSGSQNGARDSYESGNILNVSSDGLPAATFQRSDVCLPIFVRSIVRWSAYYSCTAIPIVTFVFTLLVMISFWY